MPLVRRVIALARLGVAAWLLPTLFQAVTSSASGSLPSTLGWYQIPNTKIETVCAATHGFPEVHGAEWCAGIFSWSGGVLDTTRNRLIITGGGHNAYYGNELYALNLDDLTMTRLTDPGLPPAPYSCVEGSPDCLWRAWANLGCSISVANGTQPNSRHTYNGLTYMPNVDRMFVFGGSLACGIGAFGQDTWTFDFATNTWQRMNPTGDIPRADPGIVTDYDPHTGKVFLRDEEYLYSYDMTTDSYTRLSSYVWPPMDYHLTGVIDPKRKQFVMVGGGQEWIYDIGPASTYTRQTLNSTGGSAIVNSDYPGLAYDPVTDRIVAWDGGDTVYSLNLDTRVWTPTTYPGGPGAVGYYGYGTHGRWRYVPTSGVFVLVNAYNQNAYTFRLTSAAPDTTPPTVSLTAPTAGTTVSGSSVNVVATAADDIGVAGVQFLLDGANLQSEDTTSPYSISWDTTTATADTHTITARARDAANNTTSAAVSVTVSNTTPPPAANPLLVSLPNNTALDLGVYTTNQLTTDCPALAIRMADYSRFTYDSRNHQLLFFGGGHSSTPRTDVDVFNLNTLTWGSAYTATPVAEMTSSNLDAVKGMWITTNHPYAVHTLDMLPFAENTGELISIRNPGDNTPYCTGSLIINQSVKIVHYNPVTKTWRASQADISGFANAPLGSEYDPPSGMVITIPGSGSIWRYDPIAEVKTKVIDIDYNTGLTIGYNTNLVYFPPNQKMYLFSRHVPVRVWEITLNRTNWAASTYNTEVTGMTGDIPVGGGDPDTGYAYDSVNQIIGGQVVNGKFFAYNPLTKVWSSAIMQAQPAEGTIGTQAFHALDYDPINNVFFFLTGYSSGSRMWAYRYAGGSPSSDTTPPTVSLTAPSNGATVSGTSTISASASDNVGVAAVDFLMDGSVIATDTTSPYSTSWNTAQATNGSHTLTARARDVAGNTTTSAAITVTVNNVAAAFDFSITNSGNLSVVQGQSVNAIITTTLLSGTAQSVAFSATGLPPGASATYNPSSCAPSCATIKTITANLTTPTGSYPIMVTGTGGGVTHATSFTLTVNPQGSPSPDADFQARCSASGVLLCEGFDDASDFQRATWPNSGLYGADQNAGPLRGTADAVIKASGASSLRFEYPGLTGSDGAGAWRQAMNRTFLAGETFYVQFRQRLSPEMITNDWRAAGTMGWKQSIFHGPEATCNDVELTIQSYYGNDFPIMYTDCGARGLYTTLDGSQWTNSTPLLLQQGDYRCQYGQTNPTDCYYYPQNEWVTYYSKITLGQWGQPNSVIESWVARDGQPYKQWIRVPNMTLYNSDPTRNNYSLVTLLPYMTGKDPTVDHPTAYTWYDELIVSTQPIAAPGASAQRLRGDLDADQDVDLDDLRRMIFMLVGTVAKDLTAADLDGDGQLLLVDLQALVRILVGIP